ncbi:MAG: hypothetical protein ABSG63_05685 [Spirochaetia bacterium]|jgi:hypothetical protein
MSGERLRVVGPDVHPVEVQGIDGLQQVIGAGKLLANVLVDEPLEGRHPVGLAPLQGRDDSLVSVHVVVSSP